jgi:hypothetical protein
MTLDRSEILRFNKDLNELAMATHALWERLEAIHSDIVDHVRERTAETLACAECDIDSPNSLAVAIQQGWTRLQYDDALGHNYLGMCPDCTAQAAQPPEEPDIASVPLPKVKKGIRTTLFPSDNDQ